MILISSLTRASRLRFNAIEEDGDKGWLIGFRDVAGLDVINTLPDAR